SLCGGAVKSRDNFAYIWVRGVTVFHQPGNAFLNETEGLAKCMHVFLIVVQVKLGSQFEQQLGDEVSGGVIFHTMFLCNAWPVIWPGICK
ncbi:MAG: hypothetical protein ACTHJV_14090, partial [Rhizobiaceae bacterium]